MVTCTHVLYLFLKSFITETRQISIVGSTIKLGMLYECEMSETLLLGSLITFILRKIQLMSKKVKGTQLFSLKLVRKTGTI